MHEDGVGPRVPGQPLPVKDPARPLEDLHGQVMALGRDDLVGRRAPALFEALSEAGQNGGQLRVDLAEQVAAGHASRLDELDGREPPVADDGKTRGDEPFHLGDLALDVPGAADPPQHLPSVQDRESPFQKLLDPAAEGGDDRDDRGAEKGLELGAVHFDALPLGQVHHVEGDDHRVPELDELERQLEAPAERRGVDDIDDEIGPFREEMGQDDLLGPVGGTKGIRAGQIDDVEEAAFDIDPAVGVLDGRSREVGRFGLVAGDGVEQRALAAVRLADEDDDGDPRVAHEPLRQ